MAKTPKATPLRATRPARLIPLARIDTEVITGFLTDASTQFAACGTARATNTPA